jgi:hypothetical protein
MVLNDDSQKHGGRPRTLHTDKNCATVEGLIRKDRRVRVCEIAEVTVIAKVTVREINSDLNFLKVLARWVPKCSSRSMKRKE